MWVRGLKPRPPYKLLDVEVAPRVGAWIETRKSLFRFSVLNVAPRVGAWIETTRGIGSFVFLGVAPRVGAWIETEA